MYKYCHLIKGVTRYHFILSFVVFYGVSVSIFSLVTCGHVYYFFFLFEFFCKLKLSGMDLLVTHRRTNTQHTDTWLYCLAVTHLIGETVVMISVPCEMLSHCWSYTHFVVKISPESPANYHHWSYLNLESRALFLGSRDTSRLWQSAVARLPAWTCVIGNYLGCCVTLSPSDHALPRPESRHLYELAGESPVS